MILISVLYQNASTSRILEPSLQGLISSRVYISKNNSMYFNFFNFSDSEDEIWELWFFHMFSLKVVIHYKSIIPKIEDYCSFKKIRVFLVLICFLFPRLYENRTFICTFHLLILPFRVFCLTEKKQHSECMKISIQNHFSFKAGKVSLSTKNCKK